MGVAEGCSDSLQAPVTRRSGYLNTLPIDVFKIDQSFIAKPAEQPGSHAIITAIVTSPTALIRDQTDGSNPRLPDLTQRVLAS